MKFRKGETLLSTTEPKDLEKIPRHASSINQETLDICNSIKPGISKDHVAAAEKKLNKVSSNDLQVGQEYYIYDDNGRARKYSKYSNLKSTTPQYPRNFDIFLKGTFVRRFKEHANHGWMGEFNNIKLMCQKAYTQSDIEYWKTKKTYTVPLERGVIFGNPFNNYYDLASAKNIVQNKLGLPVENESMVTDYLPKAIGRSNTKKGGKHRKHKQRRTYRKKSKSSRK